MKKNNDEGLQEAVYLLIKSGYHLDQEAFELLKEISQDIDVEELRALTKKVIKKIGMSAQKPLFINRKFLEGVLLTDIYKTKEKKEKTSKKVIFKYAKDVEPEIDVISDPTKLIGSTGSLSDYIEYFRDRFHKLTSLLCQRMDIKDTISVKEAKAVLTGSEVKFICMIAEKRETKRGVFLTVEDLESEVVVFFPSDNIELVEKARRLIADLVVCIQAIKGSNDLFIAKDVFLPDLPLRKPNTAPLPIYAIFVSDLHIGSKMFMKKEFNRFIEWLNGRIGSRNLVEISGHVKYIVIAGDIVDGVGIYPQQFDELEIKDIFDQYKMAAELLEKIPEHIEIIIIPGNHDAVRRALPQPALRNEYTEPLEGDDRIHLLGNPSVISLHGVNVLVYHGRSLDDVISLLPRMSFEEPENAMKFLLQCRHLSPVYGERTPISPERTDLLVIDKVPDIFHAGHVHRFGFTIYRGSLILNSGAWQEQTEYQKEMGHTPTPGIVPIINLQNLRVISLNFTIL